MDSENAKNKYYFLLSCFYFFFCNLLQLGLLKFKSKFVFGLLKCSLSLGCQSTHWYFLHQDRWLWLILRCVFEISSFLNTKDQDPENMYFLKGCIRSNAKNEGKSVGMSCIHSGLCPVNINFSWINHFSPTTNLM